MNKLEILVDKIKKSNLSFEDKNELIELLNYKNTDYSIFIITLFRMLGLAVDVLEKFDIDVGEILDKF